MATKYGIVLSAPGYNGYEADKGGITTYPPGAKENGGIFLHANPWVIISETMLGNGDKAFDYYSRVNPMNRNEDIENFEVEPYVFPQNLLGSEHPQFGLGRNSWLSGTASWMYIAAVEHILGIQQTYTGFRVDPCIPKDWEGFTLNKSMRGAKYKIVVHNPNKVSKGVSRVVLNGKEIKGDIPYRNSNEDSVVEVYLGI